MGEGAVGDFIAGMEPYRHAVTLKLTLDLSSGLEHSVFFQKRVFIIQPKMRNAPAPVLPGGNQDRAVGFLGEIAPVESAHKRAARDHMPVEIDYRTDAVAFNLVADAEIARARHHRGYITFFGIGGKFETRRGFGPDQKHIALARAHLPHLHRPHPLNPFESADGGGLFATHPARKHRHDRIRPGGRGHKRAHKRRAPYFHRHKSAKSASKSNEHPRPTT